MQRQDAYQKVIETGIVAIIRADSPDILANVARALYDGGISVLEVTLTVPGALDVIQQVSRDLGDKILLGAGTVLDTESARAAIFAGAEFLVSPSFDADVVKLSHRYNKLIMPGVCTPTEVVTALESGADILKVFPADIGGPGLLKAIRGPLPQANLLPTGGVNLDTVADFLKAGACAVGLGSSLVTRELVEAGDLDAIRDLSAQYVELVKKTRAEMA